MSAALFSARTAPPLVPAFAREVAKIVGWDRGREREKSTPIS